MLLRTARLVGFVVLCVVAAAAVGVPAVRAQFAQFEKHDAFVRATMFASATADSRSHGAAEGRTRTNVPVFNVSMSLMRETFPDRPFRLVEIGGAADQERRSGADRRLEIH